MTWTFPSFSCIIRQKEVAMIYLNTKNRHEITLCNLNYSPEGIYHPNRILQDYDFLYIVNGEWKITENEVTYSLTANQLLILEPRFHHYSKEKCSKEMRNLYIHCKPQIGDGVLSSNSLALNKITDCSSLPQVLTLFHQIIEESQTKQAYSKLRLQSLFDLLLTELAIPDSIDSKPADPIIRQLLHHLHSNTDRFFSPEELAAQIGVSTRTLSGKFKAATNTTIHRYQLNLKLDIAKEQLPLYPNRGLRDIALSLGFYDEFQFSKLFKRRFGIPPSKLIY